MDGSEPGEVVPAAVLSGAPVELQARTVRYVYQYTPTSILPPELADARIWPIHPHRPLLIPSIAP